ncbi:MAG: hypothetical protein AAGA55_05130 [Planctomycetota bacterium]
MTASLAEDEATDAFVWPPAEYHAVPIHDAFPDARDGCVLEASDRPPDASSRSGLLARAGDAFGQLESDLLGVRGVSFGRWASATSWRRDPSGAYCWRCAGSVGPHETDGDGCADCRGKRLAWSRAIRLGVYTGGLRAGIIDLKFARWRRTGHELGGLLGEAIGEQLEACAVSPAEAVIVPVPMSWRRRMARGVDHTAVLAGGARMSSGVAWVRPLRRQHRKPQLGLSAAARAANIRGAFVPPIRRGSPGRQLRAARVVIVLDDVRTTGATMTAACRAVRKLAGSTPQLWCCVAGVVTSRHGPAAEGGPASGAATADPSRERQKFGKTFGEAI